MGNEQPQKVPAQLLQLQGEFSSWRMTRVRGERIPNDLWKSAAKLASCYGLHQTSKLLNLGYYSLKRRMEQQQVSKSSSQDAFIELPPVSMTHSRECVIEFEDGTGAKMRMHWKGSDLSDVLALGHSFWSGE